MEYVNIFNQIFLIILIVVGSRYIYTLITDNKIKDVILFDNIPFNKTAIIVVLYNFIIIALFTIIYYNISKFSTIPQYLKNGKPHKLSLFSAMYECFITQTTVGFGDVEYNTTLVKFITMLQMSTLFINFGLLSI
tara:strand:+ start:182 stop:586 length:405 start_codon:yes stop_codon:yes gene_type:complete